MRTPKRVRSTSPPTPGRTTAASAHSEMASGAWFRACRMNDCMPVGTAPLGAGGAIPGTDVARSTSLMAVEMDAEIPSSALVLLAKGMPGTPASSSDQPPFRCHRRIHARRPPTLVDASQSVLYWHPREAHQEGEKVGLQLRQRDDRTENRGQHVLNPRDHGTNRCRARHQRDRSRNRCRVRHRCRVRNWSNNFGNRCRGRNSSDHIGNRCRLSHRCWLRNRSTDIGHR